MIDRVAASTPHYASDGAEAKELSAGGDSGSACGNESDSDGDGGGDGVSDGDGDGDSLAEPQAERADSEQTADEHRPTAAKQPFSAGSGQSGADSLAAPPVTGLAHPSIHGGSQQPNEPEEHKEAGPESAGQQGQSTGAALR